MVSQSFRVTAIGYVARTVVPLADYITAELETNKVSQIEIPYFAIVKFLLLGIYPP